jgi:cyclopropane fatty-acyl-phospholipid synthase-like methyltransferase
MVSFTRGKSAKNVSYSPIVKVAHSLLKFPICYSFLQVAVGAEGFRNRYLKNALAENTEASQLLDLGCGPGANRKTSGEGYNYTGIDLSEEYVSKASRKFKSDTQSRFIRADLVQNNDWPSLCNTNENTIAMAFALWHHLSDEQVDNVLKKLARSLNDESIILSMDPIVTSDSSKFAVWLANNDRGPYLRSQKDFERIYSRNGFSTEIEIFRNQMRIPGNIISIKAKLR